MVGGFTLVEALIALVLSSVVLLLVSSTFLVQSNYYATQTQRAIAQDNARIVTELVGGEVRGAVDDGFVVAGARTLTVRSPIFVSVVCGSPTGGVVDVYSEDGSSGVATSEVAGVAVRDSITGAWTYAYATWASLDASDASSASSCFANGADTVGAIGDFHRLQGLASYFSPVPSSGDLIMVFRETTFTIGTSYLNPAEIGIFGSYYGGSPVEIASGFDASAQFQYRLAGGGTYADTITGASIGSIDAVRVVADARRPAQTGGQSDITFGWSVNIAARNIR